MEAPEPDEDGEPITTMVVDWQPKVARRWSSAAGPVGPMSPARSAHRGAAAQAGADDHPGRSGASICRFRRMGRLVRMVDQEIVREQFYAHTPADGTPEQKRHFRRQKFMRALEWAEQRQLIGVEEIDGVTYLRLIRPDEGQDDDS